VTPSSGTPGPPWLSRVLAGPGTGKTRLIIQKLIEQLQAGQNPATMIGVTFSRRAAKEMRDRLQKARVRTPWLGTFHALAYRILVDLKQVPSPLELEHLIPNATGALRGPAVPGWIRAVRFVAVDEAQDLDATQVEFLIELRTHMMDPEFLLVGDPDQAIYGFREASAKYLPSAEATFRAPCRTIMLTENHRSVPTIVDFARRLLVPSAHPDAPCHRLSVSRTENTPAMRWLVAETIADEAVKIFEEIRTLLAFRVPANRIAIPVRVRTQFGPLLAEAARWGIPLFTPPVHEQLEDSKEPPEPGLDAVQLLTMHQSKCTEFQAAFVAGVQEGLMPHHRAQTREDIDEECRTLYVSCTRAEVPLFLCHHGQISRFCTEEYMSRRFAPSSPPSAQSSLHWLTDFFSGRKAA
jgi:superfamily I DNA/RNA helicase